MTHGATTTTHDDQAVKALIANGWLDGTTEDNLARMVQIVRDTDRRYPRMEIHYADEWAALYVNGRLDPDTVGDKYIAEEKAFDLCGVKQVQDPAFMRGQSQRSGVATTLDEVAAYREERKNRLADAARKRAQAARLLAEANELEER